MFSQACVIPFKGGGEGASRMHLKDEPPPPPHQWMQPLDAPPASGCTPSLHHQWMHSPSPPVDAHPLQLMHFPKRQTAVRILLECMLVYISGLGLHEVRFRFQS